MSFLTRLNDPRNGGGTRARALRGTFVSLIGFGGGQVIRLGANLILTRILFPEAFGLMALVQVLLTGLQMFSDTGLRPAVMQSDRGDDPAFLNTAWTVQMGRGVLLWGFAALIAWPAAVFYEQEQLQQILPVMGATMAISGLNSTWIIQANRNLKLGPETIVGLVSQLIGALAMIGFALWLQSVWALVWGTLIGATSKMILSHWIVAQPVNRFHWDRGAVRELFHFGKFIFLATIAGYFVNQGDRLILGRFVDLETLAMFAIAFALANLPPLLNGHVIERVMVPLFRSHPPLDSARNRHQIGRARSLLMVAFLGITIALTLGGEALIHLLYDPRYAAAGPLLVLLSLSFAPGLIVESYNQILLANGNSRDFSIMTFVSGVLKIALLLLLISTYGVVGAVIAPALSMIVTYPLLVYLTRRYGGWYPVQDAVCTGLLVVAAAMAISQSPELQALIQTTFLQ